MKQEIPLLIIAALVILAGLEVAAYTECTPPTCPTGYASNGTSCSGSTCVRQCITYNCTMQWTQEQSNTFGWNSNNNLQHQAVSSVYNPTNTSQCYQFKYKGPPSATTTYIRMFVASTTPDCDTEGIGGFLQGSVIPPGQSSNPWFSGMGLYTGNVGESDYNYMRIIVRGHSSLGSENDNYKGQMIGESSIYCVPQNSRSCNDLGGTWACDNDCYNLETEAYVTQGYFETQNYPNQTLYTDRECSRSPSVVNDNRMQSVQYIVYSSPVVLVDDVIETSCFRPNEAPNATNVVVKPLSPNLGQDLECTFNYTDQENYAEQGSTFEWWKNSVNQSINSRILAKGNLTINDQWYCKVTPSDGLLFGAQNQSTNTVTIATTVKNPTMTVGNTLVWNISGYYGWKEELLNFSTSLNKAIEACTPDADGFCNITMTFTSNATGVLDLTNLEVFYQRPLIYNFSAFNATGLTRIFEFQILNTNLSFSDFNWTLEPGDGIVINSTIAMPLQDNEDVFVYVQHAYSTTGFYNVTATATNGLVTDSKTITIEVTVGGDT